MPHATLAGARDGTLQGAAAMLAAMAILGLIDNFIKYVAEEAGLWQFHLVRSAIACTLVAVIARSRGVSLWPQNPAGVAARSGFAALAMAIYFGALGALPIAQVASGLFTAPLFVMLISVLAFGERIGPIRVVSGVLGFAGVLLVLRPDPAALDWASVLPMAAGLFWGLAALATRRACAGEPVLALLFWFFAALGLIGAGGLLAMAAGLGDGAGFATRGWVAPSGAFLGWTALHAVGALVAVGLLTWAYQLGETALVAPFEYSFLIFAGFWGYMLFGESLGPAGLAGLALIMLSGAVIAVRSGGRI